METPISTRKSNYITLSVYNTGIEISINRGMKRNFRELCKDLQFDENNIMSEIFEEIQCNSEFMYHFDLGESGFGITSAPGISFAYGLTEDPNNPYSESEDSELYWYPDYCVSSFIVRLHDTGKIFFPRIINQDSFFVKKYASGKMVKGFLIVADIFENFKPNPLFYFWSEHHSTKECLYYNGAIECFFGFYVDDEKTKYLIISDEDIAENHTFVERLINEHINNLVPTNVDNAIQDNRDDYSEWLKSIDLPF